MTEQPIPNGELDEDQKKRVSELSSEELLRIDEMLLSHASNVDKKVAMLVGLSLMDLQDSIPDVPDIFYAQRVKALVSQGRLLAEGSLDYMRFSEVRLP